jgi:hypothetical protein
VRSASGHLQRRKNHDHSEHNNTKSGCVGCGVVCEVAKAQRVKSGERGIARKGKHYTTIASSDTTVLIYDLFVVLAEPSAELETVQLQQETAPVVRCESCEVIKMSLS